MPRVLRCLIMPLLIMVPVAAQALTPAAADFVRSLGIDPQSEQVRMADSDGEIESIVLDEPEIFSLEKLASAKRAESVRKFVATRWFVHRLKADFDGTPLLIEDYEAAFLTASERQLVGRKVAMSLIDE